MKIIDAQIHLWTMEHAVVVPPHRTEPFGIEEALHEMDAAGVHGAIVSSAAASISAVGGAASQSL